MQLRQYLGLLGLFIVLILFGSAVLAEIGNTYVAKFSSIGLPATLKQYEAMKISDLIFFDNKLYLGHGDAVVNTGPTDIMYYDFDKNEFITEFTVDDEAIYLYRIVDGQLAIPGPDATEDWDLGNIYVLEDDGWKKLRTITHGIHVNDIVSYSGNWYVSTGSYFELGEEEMVAFGSIMRSENKGESWQTVYSTPGDELSVYRVGSLVELKNTLYAFTYAYTSIKQADVPEKYKDALDSEDTGDILLFKTDIIGSDDVVTFDGSKWSTEDIIPVDNVSYIAPYVFNDKLILRVISGEFVTYLASKKDSDFVSQDLFVFDGNSAEKIDLQFDAIQDVVVRGDMLLMLIRQGEDRFITRTRDLKTWDRLQIPGSIDDIRCFEYDGSDVYLGTVSGNIFKTQEPPRLISGPMDSDVWVYPPEKICGCALLPQHGRSYWLAITQWDTWGQHATIEGKADQGLNTIRIKTDNVSEFQIFVPTAYMNTDKPIILDINGKKYFEKKLNDRASLICKLRNNKWRIKRSKISQEDFEPSPKIIGSADLDMTNADGKYPSSQFKAEVMKWAAKSDLAISMRSGLKGSLPAGDITLGDVVGINYPNTICTFKATGKELMEIMGHTIQLSDRDQCCIAGMEVIAVNFEGSGETRIDASSFDAEREYMVAAGDYTLKNAEKFLGRKFEYSDTGVKVGDAMIQWFLKNKRIRKSFATGSITLVPPTEN